MVVRRPVADLIRSLATADEGSLEWLVTRAHLVLDQSAKYIVARRAPVDEQTQAQFEHLPGGWLGWLARRSHQLNEEFRDMLPEPYVGLMLTDPETDGITHALLALLDRPVPVVTWAVGAVGASRRLYAVPRVADVLQRHAARDGPTAINAIRALGALLTSEAVDNSPVDDVQQAAERATSVLRYAAAEGLVDGRWNVRQAAESEIRAIDARLDH